MVDDLTLALAQSLAPLKYDRAGYIWGRSEKGGLTVIANIRGWGYLTGQGHGALGMNDATATARQLAWCEMICVAVNKMAGKETAELRVDTASAPADAVTGQGET